MKSRRVPGLIAGSSFLAVSALVAFFNLSAKPHVDAVAASGVPATSSGAASAPARSADAPGAASGTSGSAPGKPGASPASGPGGGKRGGNATVVQVARAELGSLAATAKLTGEVQAVKTLKAYPDTAGRLTETVSAGTKVAEGSVVARVDPSKPGSRFEPSPVRAPLAGSVVAVLLEAGANVTTSSAILEIATLEDLDVVVRVPERWAADIVVGSKAEVRFTALPGRRFSAVVRSADPVIDPVSRSKRILLKLSGDLSRIEPGMFAEVSATLSRSSSSLVIPLESVVRRGDSDFVYVVENGVARERVVRLGLFSETGAEVLNGLSRGDAVVVRGQNLIRDGSRVSQVEGAK